MVIAMAQPWRHPETGAWYFRGRVPADLKDKLTAQKLSLRVGGKDRVIALTRAGMVKVSLGTKDAGEAKLRHAGVQAQLQERWAMARKEVSLTHEQLLALAGLAYRDLVSEHRAEPGRPESWEMYAELLREPLVWFDEASDGVTSEPYNPKRGMRELAPLVDLDQLLGAEGLSIDQRSRERLIPEVAYARAQAAERLARFGEGDYSPDPVATRFPEWRAVRGRARDEHRGHAKLDALLEGWMKEAAPKQATADLWRSYLADFVAFAGHDDAAAFRREDVIGWKQKLLDEGNSVKTINDGKLAALKAVLGWAAENGLVKENAAARVSVKRGKKAGADMQPLSMVEAAAILNAAEQERSPVYRWVPLLCAASGARVSEVAQLRAEDIGEEDGVWFMEFRAEAGSLKNPNSERKVPLHPQVLEAGFLDFVRGKSGPLFFDPKRRREGAKKPQAKIVAKNVASWVHGLGLEVGRKHRKDPNHAWRHWFVTLARDAGVQEPVLIAITGHAPRTVAQAYGAVPLKTAARAVAAVSLPTKARQVGPPEEAGPLGSRKMDVDHSDVRPD